MVGVSRPNFGASWEELKEEREETFALSNANTIPEAVKNIIGFLGMQPCDRTDRVPEGKSSHAVLLAGNSKYKFEYIYYNIVLQYVWTSSIQ
jgi:coatomer protein complex subunit gamma